MVQFAAPIHKYLDNGEKTGWSYVDIPLDIAQQLKPDCKVSFRVKGMIDHIPVEGLALIPVGEGNFILALKQKLRKQLGKEKGAIVALQLEEDKDFKYEIPEDLYDCLIIEEHLMENFLAQPKSHQNYFIKWINEAKTEATRTKRITQTVVAMDKKQDFGQMIRSNRKQV